MLFNIL